MNNVDFDELLKQGVICAKKQITAYCTTDLSIFKENELNRDIKSAKVMEFLLELQAGSYTPKPFLTVLPDLTIADGHHRVKAIKQYLAQKDCPVKEFPVWFEVSDDEDFIHHANTAGSFWQPSDHIKHYNNRNYPHYAYLYQCQKDIKKAQKDMRISCAIAISDITRYLSGFDYPDPKNRACSTYALKNGDYKVKIKKEYLFEILPYFKEIQAVLGFQILCKASAHSFKCPLFEFLLVMHMIGMDMEFVTSKIVEITNPSRVFASKIAIQSGGVKQILFDTMGIKFKKRAFKAIANLADIAYIESDYEDFSFTLLFRLLAKLIRNNFFRPEGVYKQEEIMKQMEQEELMNQNQ